jgi:methionine synthase I (cobalamin-dependent)
VLQPNAGQPRIGPDGPVYAQQAGDFARDMAALGALGVRGLGGCCGTDPGFIAALRARLAEGGA